MTPLLGNIGTGSCMLSSLDVRESKLTLLAQRLVSYSFISMKQNTAMAGDKCP